MGGGLQRQVAAAALLAAGLLGIAAEAPATERRPHAGAVARTQQDKNLDTVSVLDFGADPSGATDSTAAFNAAQGAGNRRILIPAGSYLLDGLRVKSGVVFQGDGKEASILKQASPSRPALHARSDAGTGQLIGIGLLDVKVVGRNTAGAPAVKVEASTPYVVSFSHFRYTAYQCSTALEIACPSQEVYECHFDVFADASVGTAFKTRGAYNTYDLRSDHDGSDTLADHSLGATFVRCTGAGRMYFGGQNCVVMNPTVETIFGTPTDSQAMDFAGSNLTAYAPVIQEVATTKCNTGFRIQKNATLIGPRIWGKAHPTYPMEVGPGSRGTVVDFQSNAAFTMDAYAHPADLANWRFYGDCSTAIAKWKSATYREDTWTPVFSNLASSGTPACEGSYTQIGNMVFFTIKVRATAGTEARTPGTTFTLPSMPARKSSFQVLDGITGASIGVGLVHTDGKGHCPAWPATAEVVIAGSYPL